MRFDAPTAGSATAAASGTFGLRTFTIETWFRRGEPGSGSRNDVGIATGDGGLRSAVPLVTRGSYDPTATAGERPRPADRINWFLGIDTATAVLVADFQDTTGSNHPIAGTTALADGVWYHATATFDGVAWRLYLNGRSEAEQPAGGADPDPSGLAPVSLATSLAADGTTARGAFDGSMDEVRIWDVARSLHDIRADMRRPIDALDAGLVAAWALDESAGRLAPDSVEPGAPLTLRGGSTWLDSPVPDASVPPAPRSLSAFATLDGIALAWTSVAADDLAGYAVYRSSATTVDPTGGPISGWHAVASNSFLDASAIAGVTYTYVVTAVDRYGNESAPSGETSAALATPPDAAPLVDVHLDLSSTAPATGRQRIDPGAPLRILVSVTPTIDLPAGTLALGVPAGWTVTDGDGAGSVVGEPRLTWHVANVRAGTLVTRMIALLAPLVSPIDGGADVESTFGVSFEQASGVSDGPRLTILVAPPVAIEHVSLGQVDELSLVPTYLPVDDAILDQQRFEVFRVRFQVENMDDVAVEITPLLEVRDPAGGPFGGFAAVPELEGVTGLPFYVAREWTAVGGGIAGTELGTNGEPIDPSSLRMTPLTTDGLTPTLGHHSMGRNPAPALWLPPRSVTEVEFSVRATVDAPYLSGYEFRITDAGTAIGGAATAIVGLGPEPPLLLSPGQHQGQPVGGAAGATAADPVAYRLTPPDVATPREAPRYALLAVARTSTGTGPSTLDALGSDPAHGPFSGSTDACALCHVAHSAQGANLLQDAAAQSNLCFRCHDSAGTGASTRVESQYTDPNAPANDPATGAYFRHDAEATGSGHSQAQLDEFGGQADRHNECGDCHDPHQANGAESTQTADGWTAPGQLQGISGVAVANGPAGSAPSYTFLDGSAAPISLEYQLCFKCHSGFTTLNANDSLHPSRWAKDKAVELNPANDSFHPIEGAGRNATTAMANSLAGTSPYKLWNFTTGSTIRCVNCHGDPRKVGPTPGPAAGSDLAPHAVTTVVAADGTQLNRGLLLQAYRDRVLKGPADVYAAVDSALCLVCHKQAPFVDVSGNTRTDTNFRLHGKHVASLRNQGAGLGDIDTPGAGRGNAVCSECHYRIHSTSSRNDFRTGAQQTGTDGGLVIFAPNVIGTGAPTTIDWTRAGTNGGSCTLRCHGKGHSAEDY